MATETPDIQFVIVVNKDNTVLECDTDQSQASVTADLIAGQLEDTAYIYELFPAEGGMGNITEDVARDVLEGWAKKAHNPEDWDTLPSFVEAQIPDDVADVKAAWGAEGQAEANHIKDIATDWRASRGCHTTNGHIHRHLSSRPARFPFANRAAGE